MSEPQSTMQLAVARECSRWYKLKDHPVQLDLVNDSVRFKTVPAGRRSGKTERAKRFMVRECLRQPLPYFLAAPTHAQAKKIWWDDMKAMSFSSSMPGMKVSESELTIKWPHGASVTVIGLDQPQRIEGQMWGGGVIDEIADIKEDAWAMNIKPALDTVDPRRPDYRAWCWLIGVPEGFNHFHDRVDYALTSGDPEWKNYHWKSAEILPAELVDAARRTMSVRQFRQEYEASFETFVGRIYEDYGQANVSRETLAPHEQIMWFHDFNFTPMSSGIGVRRGEALYCVDEIVLTSAIAKQSAIEFVNRFERHANKSVIIYGDPAGRAGEKHGHASDYTEMEQVLRSAGWTVQRKVKAAAPAIRDRQNAVRAKICTASGDVSLYVNAVKCPYLHKGLSTVQLKDGSTFQEDQSDSQHITTAVGYCIDFEWPIRMPEIDHQVQRVQITSPFRSLTA
jgi:hypothetical protein